MTDDRWELNGVTLWERRVTFPMADPPPRQPFKVSGSVPMPDVPDGDYTAEFLEAGTTFVLSGVVNSAPIPVERGWVENGRLHFEGTFHW